MLRLSVIHSRINELYAVRVGSKAAELEYQAFINRFWLSGAEAFTVVFGVVAFSEKSWGFVIIALLGTALMLTLLARSLILRHKFFQAISIELKFQVNSRHPVRGVPNWRRKLSVERTQQLDAQFNAWCESRGIARRVHSTES